MDFGNQQLFSGETYPQSNKLPHFCQRTVGSNIVEIANDGLIAPRTRQSHGHDRAAEFMRSRPSTIRSGARRHALPEIAAPAVRPPPRSRHSIFFIRLFCAQLQPVQRALAGQRLHAPSRLLPSAMDPAVGRDRSDPLSPMPARTRAAQPTPDAVRNIDRIAPVAKTLGQARQQVQRRSVCRNSSAPPSEVMFPPLNRTTAEREKCASNSNPDWVHSVSRKRRSSLGFKQLHPRMFIPD